MKTILETLKKHRAETKLIMTIISLIALSVSVLFSLTGHKDFNDIFDPSYIAIVLSGLPIVFGAIKGIIKDHDITADVLVSLALIGACILKEWFAAGEVAFIMQVGSLLEDFTASKAKKGITKLIRLTPLKATLIAETTEKSIDVEDVNIGDLLRVKAGEYIPVDGIIVEGRTSIDQSSMTGESIPKDMDIGDEVMSGTVNETGSIIIRATKRASDSSLQRIIKIAKSADAQKANIVKKANKWASYLVIISFTTALIAGLIIGLVYDDFLLGFQRGVNILVVFCPCAFILATPTAITAGIGNASKYGVIIKSGEALERLSDCNTVVFDKTGTLTKGQPKVVSVNSLSSMSKEEILQIAAFAEHLSNHPLAKAIVNEYKGQYVETDNHNTIGGSGITFSINGRNYLIGNRKLLAEYGITIDNQIEESAKTIVYLATSEECLGYIEIEDQIKDNADKVIDKLHSMGYNVILCTGDNEKAAMKIRKQLNIDECFFQMSPEGKMKKIKELEKQGLKVCMFGDGVNDSLALRSAYAGIAMGKIGSDVAVESSDAVIVNDNLEVIPYLFDISKKTQKRITFNLLVSMGLNLIAVVLAIAGILNTVYGAVFHNVGSVLVVINAFLLYFTKPSKKRQRMNKQKYKSFTKQKD